MSFEEKVFGNMPDGRVVKAYTLKNKDLEVTISQYGARIAKALFCGVSVICGFDCLDGELADTSYQGACVGRYANRISDGKFTLNGKEYTMPEMTFDAICELEERGVYLMGMDRSDRRFATMIRGIAAWIMDTDTATASRELQEHISNGGNIIDILTAATEAIEDSGFF